jgi:ABC-2 type transport system ATP-binding protein
LSEYVLKTIGLTKVYSGKAANDGIDISIKQGDIYGLIGNNGAGKTTLFRMITGLIAPTKGSMELFGKRSENEIAAMRRRLGCVIETPALYPGMTARENLEYRRRLLGLPDKKAIDEVLKTVRLQDTGGKKVKRFSQGMKQRLGIAIALLGNPDFLILDEPVNGLDPAGIIEVRELLLRLNADMGVTILISSHILSELSKLVTRYGIISGGKLVEQIYSEELDERCRRYINIKVDDVSKASFILETVIGASKYEVIQDGTIRLYEMFGSVGSINAELVRHGILVEEIKITGRDLEAYFISLMGGKISA